MATTEKLIDAPVEKVFEVLADPEACAECVIGSDGISLLEYDPNVRLVVEVDRPLGVARVDLEVIPQNGGTCVRMIESPMGGLLKRLNNGVLEMVTHMRNARGLDRLARVAESSGQPVR